VTALALQVIIANRITSSAAVTVIRAGGPPSTLFGLLLAALWEMITLEFSLLSLLLSDFFPQQQQCVQQLHHRPCRRPGLHSQLISELRRIMLTQDWA
jgi:hypothetical protein